MARRKVYESCIPRVTVTSTDITVSASGIPYQLASTTTVSTIQSTSEAPSVPVFCPENNGIVFKNPDANCTGYYVDAHCVPHDIWMAMYFSLWPLAPNPLVLNSVPELHIQGPDSQCHSYRFNGACLNPDDLRSRVTNLMTVYPITSTMSTTITPSTSSPPSSTRSEEESTQAPPAPSSPTPSPPPHKSNPKLALLTIPLVLIVLALIAGVWFWHRRKTNPKPSPTSTSDTIQTRNANQEPTFTLGDLYAGRVPYPVKGEPALMEFEDEQARGTWRPGKTYEEVDREREVGWSRKGVKYFNKEHERRELERERRRGEALREKDERVVEGEREGRSEGDGAGA